MTELAEVVELGPRLLGQRFGHFEARDAPEGRNPAALYVGGLSTSASRDTMARALGNVAALASSGALDADRFPWERIRYADLEAIKVELRDRYSPATVNLYLSAVRGALRAAWGLRELELPELERALSVKSVRHRAILAGRALRAGELRELFATLARSPKRAARRDALMLAFLYACGLRRTELVGLDLADLDLEAHEATVRQGKGRRARVVAMPTRLDGLLGEWLEVRGDAPGALFLRLSRAGAVGETRVGATSVLTVCRKWARASGVAAFSPHDLRRTYTSDLLASGVDPLTVADLLGHAHLNTTRRYDRRGESARHGALERLALPF